MVNGLVFLLVLANVINLGADLNAMGDSARLDRSAATRPLYSDRLRHRLAAAPGVPSVREVRERAEVADAVVAGLCRRRLRAHVDWAAALRSTLVMPTIHWSKDYVDHHRRDPRHHHQPLSVLLAGRAGGRGDQARRGRQAASRSRRARGKSHLRRLHIDTFVGMGFSNLIAFFMILATAATLHAHGVTSIETTSQAAEALRADRRAVRLRAVRARRSSAPACWRCRCLPARRPTPSRACSACAKGWTGRLPTAKPFYGILAAAMVVGHGDQHVRA